MIRFAVAALATCALACAPAIAHADNFIARVKTNDLNLQTEAGVKTALERVHRAAVNTCSDVEVGSHIAHPDQACVAQVSAELIKRINVPTLQAAYDAQKASSGQS
jgi:UrcA family protein